MKRILLYVHYNKYDNLSSHVLYQLEKMRPLFEDILFISNSNLSKSDKDKLEKAELISRNTKYYSYIFIFKNINQKFFFI